MALDPDGLFALVSTLELCRRLHTLRLTGLQRGGMPMLKKETLLTAVTSIRNMAVVRTLDLSRNALDDEIAAQPIARLLANNASLTSLSLRSNNLSHGTARSLLSHLPTNRTLIELDTSDNVELRWPGQATEYAKLFRENVTLTSFGASLQPDGITSMLNTCSRSPARMRRLQLTMMPLSDEHTAVLCSYLLNKQVRRHASPSLLMPESLASPIDVILQSRRNSLCARLSQRRTRLHERSRPSPNALWTWRT